MQLPQLYLCYRQNGTRSNNTTVRNKKSRKTTFIDTTAYGHIMSLATVSYLTATVTIIGTHVTQTLSNTC